MACHVYIHAVPTVRNALRGEAGSTGYIFFDSLRSSERTFARIAAFIRSVRSPARGRNRGPSLVVARSRPISRRNILGPNSNQCSRPPSAPFQDADQHRFPSR